MPFGMWVVSIVWAVAAGSALVAYLSLMAASRRRRRAAADRIPLSIETIDRTFVKALVARGRSDRLRRWSRPVLWSCALGMVALTAASVFLPPVGDLWLVLGTVLLFAALAAVVGPPLCRLVEEFHTSLLTDGEELAAEMRHRLRVEGQ